MSLVEPRQFVGGMTGRQRLFGVSKWGAVKTKGGRVWGDGDGGTVQ